MNSTIKNILVVAMFFSEFHLEQMVKVEIHICFLCVLYVMDLMYILVYMNLVKHIVFDILSKIICVYIYIHK